jgi:hypothetical protein
MIGQAMAASAATGANPLPGVANEPSKELSTRFLCSADPSSLSEPAGGTICPRRPFGGPQRNEALRGAFGLGLLGLSGGGLHE